jgi:hypothetical protein
MSKTIAVLATVAALSFASGAQAGSSGSFFYNGGHHSSEHEGGEGSSSSICNRIRIDFLRRICRRISSEHEHPVSPH